MRVIVNGVMSSTTPELHQTWDGSSCCYLSPSMSESMLYLWNWGDEHLKGDESPSSISTACSEAGIRQRTSQLESKRGRPRAEIISHLIVEGSTSPSAIKCTYCNRVFPREKSLQAHLRTHTGTSGAQTEAGIKGKARPTPPILILKDDIKCDVDLLADLESSVGPSKQEFFDQVSISGKIRDVQLTNIQNGEQEFQTPEYRQSMSLVLVRSMTQYLESRQSLIPGWLRLYSACTQRIFPQHGAARIDDRDSCFHDRPHALIVLSLYSGCAQRRERPYPCDYPGCNRAFTQSGQRKTHQRLHTGEKPFVCSHIGCEMRFTHANRHCPQHPFGGIHRSDDFVLRPVESNPEQSSEVLRWLERYKLEREEKTPSKTPTKIIQKRYKTKKREIENENTSSPLKKPKFRKDLSNEMEQQENCSDMLESVQNECVGSFWQAKLMPFHLMYPENQVCREL
uniref:(California timema) hypothetical protein n=1 Tax=Timema californicum TaxID=61474 RepID=A0A7R9P965_TIMCA|nr:unnamed protein product [Timema californicum]